MHNVRLRVSVLSYKCCMIIKKIGSFIIWLMMICMQVVCKSYAGRMQVVCRSYAGHMQVVCRSKWCVHFASSILQPILYIIKIIFIFKCCMTLRIVLLADVLKQWMSNTSESDLSDLFEVFEWVYYIPSAFLTATSLDQVYIPNCSGELSGLGLSIIYSTSKPLALEYMLLLLSKLWLSYLDIHVV